MYPGRRFRSYSLLGDDIVIGDNDVANVYLNKIESLGVKISKPKSLISDTGFYEFEKKFRGPGVDLSPISVKMSWSPRFSVALMPVMKQIGCSSIRISMRLKGASLR